ncbi:MAG: M14 metallopeptidase family protein [Bacteroidota bacterium]|nr:M14 metallopeptidase family protein [Bacteroidota bacterium]
MKYSRNRFVLKGLYIIALLSCSFILAADEIPDPETFFGHKPGADKKLIRWEQMLSYFETLDNNSSRIEVRELGRTTMGNPFILAIISSPENLANLSRYKDISKNLAEGRISQIDSEKLAEEGKTIALITCSMHATECGPTQMSPLLAYDLVTDGSERIENILDNVILLLIPCWNPDGNIMVTDWYRQNVGTEFERSPMPWLYHHYAGHDNNRDAFMHNLVETRYVNNILYHEWFPQLLMDMHQMGRNDARLFLSPLYEPRHHSLHPLVTRQIELTGAYMRTLLEEENKKGVIHYANWNHWRMSAIHTEALWHNVTTILFEAASADLASPVYQEESELTRKSHGGLGKQDNEQTINHPNPWKGGWWRLGDIVEYSYLSCMGFLESAALHRERYLTNIYKMARSNIESGVNESPYAFIIPVDQKDPNRVAKMVSILIANGVKVHMSESRFSVGDREYGPGTYVVLTSQAYRPFVLDILGPQYYPDRRLWPGGPPEHTFDITGWTLPYQMGINVVKAEESFKTGLKPLTIAEAPVGTIIGKGSKYIIDHYILDSYKAVNDLLEEGYRLGLATESFTSEGKIFPQGSIIVSGRKAGNIIRELAKEYNLQVHACNPRVKTKDLKPLRMGLYKPFTANMDEGWTRWIFDNWNFPYTTLLNVDIQEGGLKTDYDVIIVPNINSESILNGHPEGTIPPEYAGGIGDKGAEAFKEFVKEGGTLISLNKSCKFAIDHFGLPIIELADKHESKEFFCPSAILRVDIDTTHPIGYGMNSQADILLFDSPFMALMDENEIINNDLLTLENIRIIARYISHNPFRSGRLIGGNILREKPVLIEARYGKGKIILFAFRPQNRAQTEGTFMLFFNSLYYR